ncbi:MAG: mechanosensitive ion channel [Methylococcaceae bacterium]
MKTIITSVQDTHRWKIFVLILLAIMIIGTVISLIARHTFIRDDIETRPRVAVVGPANSVMGTAFKQGVQLYIDTLNRQGGYNGRQVEFFTVDETPETAESIAADKRVVAVVGHLNLEILQNAAPVYERSHIPVVTPLFLSQPLAGITALGLDLKEQARFVANYARNIQQQRLMYVVREADAKFDPLVEPFEEVYKRFETPIKQVWTLSNGPDAEAQLQRVLDEIKNIDIGGIYIATNPDLAVRIVKGIRDSGNSLELYGPAQLASSAFSGGAAALSKKDAAVLTHGIIAATPVLFDTANEKAQHFQSRYQQQFGQSPDWLATYAYDAAQVAFSDKPGIDVVKGITGTLNFVDRQAQLPIQMGIYNGDRLISAPVQLLPIAKGASFNYIEALRQGRVLYVNDRFMFKTNVVYVGVMVNEISDLDLQKETVIMDMSIWFRYRGSFSPQDLQVFNGVEPIKLDSPEETKESEDVQYRRYRIKQKFKLNFTDAKRAYGQHIAGISFRHRNLNYNNLMYVVDVLGMPTGNALITDLHQRKVVKSNTGWAVDNAWESQDLVSENGEGAPQYVGMTGEQPFFSKITLGTLLKPATANARDIIPSEYFIYIAIFGIIGAGSALAMDVRQWGRFWAVQSWLLRLIFWPLVLLSVGNLTLDWAFSSLAPATTRTFVVAYESLWWILGAWLFDIGIRRFVWESLMLRTQYKIPNILKIFTSILIFSFAFSGIMVVVLNQSPTSLLATSGVLAMVVGMAVKNIIANVFSGIILNFERPFKVGDQIKINNVVGEVKDITWRVTQVESSGGQMISLANGKVTEAFMENYSLAPNGVSDEVHFYTRPDTDPTLVLEIIIEGLAQNKTILRKKAPSARYKGIINENGYWVADFAAGYQVETMSKKSPAKEELWLYVRQKFVEHKIPLIPIDQKPSPI